MSLISFLHTENMKTTHTPGPWSIAPSFAGQWIKAGDSYICPLPDHIEHEGKPCGSVASQDKTQAEINANAALIAAAPELLAALRALTNCLDYRGMDTHEMDAARAAIFKAERGEE